MEELNSLEDLLDLQRVDSDIDRLLDRRQSLPELAAYRTQHEQVSAVEAQLAELRAALEEAERHTHKGEGELDLAQQKLEREERRLFAGGISAKEAEHLRQEVQMLRTQISGAEDEILGHMETREARERDIAEAEAQLAELQTEKDRLSGIISQAWKDIDADVGRLEQKKAELIPLIAGPLLELYEDLRPRKEGVAVGRLGEGVCGGCHLRLSAAEQDQALKGDPPRCMHCRRILVPQ